MGTEKIIQMPYTTKAWDLAKNKNGSYDYVRVCCGCKRAVKYINEQYPRPGICTCNSDYFDFYTLTEWNYMNRKKKFERILK